MSATPAAPSDSPPRIGRVIGEYAVVAALTVAMMAVVLQLWNFHFFIPNAYYGDGYAYLAIIQGMIEEGWKGWVLHIDRLGAPTGAVLTDTMVYQQGGLHNFLMKLIGFVVPESGFVLNAYYMLGFPLIGMATYGLMREAKIGRVWSFAGSVLFNFSCYHFCRNTVHIYLGAFFMVPLGMLVVLWLAQGRLVWRQGESYWQLWRDRRFRISVAILFLLAISDGYYTFFTLVLLALQGAFFFYRAHPHPWRQMALLGTLLLVVGVGAASLILPTLPDKMHHANPEAQMYPLKRHFYMADFNALRLDTMVMPAPVHRIDRVRNFISSYQVWLRIRSETISSSIGALPTIGFLLGLAILLVWRRRMAHEESQRLLDHLSLMNAAMMLLGTIGGLGVLLAILYPEIRCYARLSLIFGLTCSMILCLVMDHAVNPWLRRRAWGPGVAMLLPIAAILFALYDQTPSEHAYTAGEYSGNATAMQEKNARYTTEKAFFERVEKELPEGTNVFQLPYISFWTYSGRVGSIEYEHLIPYLHTRHLRWTYGSVVGTAVDLWQRRVTSKPLPDALREMAAMGFGAVYVDREGYADKGTALVAQLRRNLPGEPIVSANDRWLIFPLPDPGFRVIVDPATYRPIRIEITRRDISPAALPDYIRRDAFAAWETTRSAETATITGPELAALLDREMVDVLTGYDDKPLPNDAWHGGVTCPATTWHIDPKHGDAFFRLPVTIRNDSDVWWNFDATRANKLVIGTHATNASGVTTDTAYRLPVGRPVRPHSATTVEAWVPAALLQNLPGVQRLQFDALEEGVAWLSGKAGGMPCTVTVINGEGAR